MKETHEHITNDLLALVQKHFDPGELFTDEKILDFVKHEFDVDQVFDEPALNAWALNNGYTKDPNYE